MKRRSSIQPVELNLTPLIDVVFLLLIFFMVSTTFNKDMQIQIELPTSSSDVPQETQDILEIAIDSGNNILVNGTPITENNLASLQALIMQQWQQDQFVVISADALSNHQTHMLVVDALSRLGISRIGYTTVLDE
ncbi:ExbD/TolR family protein [Salinibius halmophilus]|uniref:ExbD/TolR family protein n=1 Tax=Salinibius halmophilus TaxID=1853216 RepID=UPI0013140DA1|nr:biopolymer transporter ExbD [Salinibius halmophilus]